MSRRSSYASVIADQGTMMIKKLLAPSIVLALVVFLTISLSACTTETIEVTRIKILERRVIERVQVTVEVTRLHRVVATPRPTSADLVPPALTTTPELTATLSSSTPTPTAPKPTSNTPQPTLPSARVAGQSLMNALQNTEQTLLSLVQALNSNPLPIDATVQFYNALRGAATITIPAGEDELQSIYFRYREQVETTVGQGNDLYTHLVQIQAGEANQTEPSPIHLSLARDAASASTSTVQALLRELETFLASQP